MRTLTDSEGQKYEIVKSDAAAEDSSNYIYGLRPIKAVEKKYWSLWFQPDGENRAALSTDKLSEPTAQKVAAAIVTLMAYIQHPKDYDFEEAEDYKWVARQARKAFLEDV